MPNCVHGLLGGLPLLLGCWPSVEEAVERHLLSHRPKIAGAHTEQPHSTRWIYGLEQRLDGFDDAVRSRDRRRQRDGPTDGVEVSETHLEREGTGRNPLGTHASGNSIGEANQLTHQLGMGVAIRAERLLVADRLHRSIHLDRPVVDRPCQSV